MNAELVASKEQRIVVPTGYYGNCLGALKATSNRISLEPIILAPDFAHRILRGIVWKDFSRATREPKAANAFMDSCAEEEQAIRFRITKGTQ